MASFIEIVAGPLELWWAPVGESYPNVDTAPAGNWVLVGSSGDDNYHEDGVVVNVGQDVNLFTPLGSTIAKKAFRTSQEISVGLTMVDLSLANLRVAFNSLTVTSDAGPPATKSLNLDFGTTVAELALLVRGTGNSPELDAGNLQFELNRVIEMAPHPMTFVKGDPVGIELEFRAMQDASGNVGQLIVAD